MKHTLISLLVIVAAIAYGQERSDRDVVKQFDARYKTILASIKQVKSVMDCAEVSTAIDDLEGTFRPSKALIDKVYFEQGFDEKITEARVQLRLAQEKLGIIEGQVKRIAELETQIKDLSEKIGRLDQDNAKLMGDMKRLSDNVRNLTKQTGAEMSSYDSLKAVVAKLQQALKERDNMIFSLVDSLFLQYDKNIQTMSEMEKRSLMAKVGRHDVFANVKKSITDNAVFLESTTLTANDIASITREQRRFTQQWNAIAPRLGPLYLDSKQKSKELATIDTMLAYWKSRVDVAYWRSFNAVFKEKGVSIPEFSNGQQFYVGLMSYLNNEIQNPGKLEPGVRQQRYTHFVDSLWKADVGYVWVSQLISDGQLTDQQKKELDLKVDEWRVAAIPPVQPVSPYYYVIAGLLAILLIALLIRAFSKKR